MKALLLIPTLTAGGAERVASILANVWCQYPQTSVTLLLMFDDEIFFSIDKRVTIRRLGLVPRRRTMARLGAIVRGLFRFRRIVREESPTFVLSFMNKYNVFCLAALFGADIPTIVSERDSPTEERREINWRWRQVFYPFAAGAITQTNEGKQHLLSRIGYMNVAVINNPIAVTGKIQPYSSRDKIVLNVGRLVGKKGQADLLRAFAKVEMLDWQLVICGDGPLRQALEQLAGQLGLHGRVRFMGTVKDINSWYSRARVFAFPSYFEGFPNALAEAMLAGVPSISYDCATGPSELIEHGKNGYLVPVGDVERMAQCLKELMTDSSRCEQFSENALRLTNMLDPTMIAKRYFEFCGASAAPRPS